jgi:hypothetical protein
MDYKPRCHCGVQADRQPDDGLSQRVFGSFLTARMGVLEGCHKRSCWKNSIRVSVPRPYRSDVYVCSKSCRLCLTVVN